MTDTEDKVWKTFLRRHKKMFALFVVAAIIAAICAIYVFVWFVGDAQATGLVPSSLGSWSIGTCVTFVLNLIFWELVLIGIPVIIFVVAVYKLWWMKLPKAERKEYKRKKLFGKKTRKTDGGEGQGEHAGIAAVMALPKTVAQNRERSIRPASASVVFRCEHPTEER